MVVPDWFFLLAMTLFGLVFGSFANVVIWRLPREESLSVPGSHCPSCGHPVRWYDNIPLVSWALLRARCRDCGEPISVRYPLVEALSGALWLVAGVRFGVGLQAVAGAVFLYLLLVLSAIDIDTYRLPDPLVGWLAGFGLAGALLWQFAGVPVAPLVGVSAGGLFASPLTVALVGAALGFLVPEAVRLVYQLAFHRKGLGAGDVKLLGAMGLFLGPYVLLALFVGSLAGSVGGVLQLRRRHEEDVMRTPFQFGPYLAFGGALAALAGPLLWGLYLAAAGLR